MRADLESAGAILGRPPKPESDMGEGKAGAKASGPKGEGQHAVETRLRPVHAISVHPHSDGKGYTVHHHNVPAYHPDYHHIANLETHGIVDADSLAQHMKDHASKLHMAASKGQQEADD